MKTSLTVTRFLAAGAIAAMTSFICRVILSTWIDYATAIGIAYVVGMVTAFVLMRSCVFSKGQNTLLRSGTFFILVNLLGLLQTLGVSLLLYQYLFPLLGVQRFSREIAHAIGIAVPAFTSYFGHKRWSFE